MPDTKYVIYQKANIKSIMFGVIAILISLLLLNYFVMPNKKSYSIDFTYNIDSLNNGKYYNGSSFNYKLITANENLNLVVNKNPDLASINANKIIRENGIQINRIIDDNSNNYTIKVNSKYFKNKEQAKMFLSKLCEQPVLLSKNIVKKYNYQTELNKFNNANSLETKINCLKTQTKLIKEKYLYIQNNYGDINVTNEKKISDVINEIELFEKKSNLSILELEIEKNGYVLSDQNTMNELKYQKSKVEDTLNLTKTKLNSLVQIRDDLLSLSTNIGNIDLSNLNDQIINLTLSKIDLENEIFILDKKINSVQDNDSFETFMTKISNYHNELTVFTSSLEQTEIKILTDEYKVVYQSNINTFVNVKYEIVLAIESILIGMFVGISTNFALKFINTQTFKSVKIRERFRFTRYM